jgi:hypothetical protein
LEDLLQKFEHALTEQELGKVQRTVEELVTVYVTRKTSPDVRKSICLLLRRKADEATSRAYTAYLRAVAECIEQYSDPAGSDCLQKAPQSKDETRPNRLGEFLSGWRK